MGGNVFPTGTTRRYLKDEYFDTTPRILNKLCLLPNVAKVALIPSYRDKESFGDADILYSTFNDIPLGVELGEIYCTKNVSRNTNVTSIEYNELQVDFIHTKDEQFNYGLSYFSHNDIGNLNGKIFRRFGLKHGHNGLVLPLRDGNNLFGEITLTLVHARALEFIGLSPKKFNEGFKDLQEIFEYVSSSPYFDPDAYKLENVSSAGRVRDKKRDTYQKFLKYCENWTGNRPLKVEDKTVYLERIFEAFPLAYAEYKMEMFELATQKFIKEKFNGDLVGEWTGLGHRSLGAFMKLLRQDFYFRPENIVYLTIEQIKSRVMEAFESGEKLKE